MKETCLRVSEIIGCKRALWFKHKNYKKLTAHPLSSAGSELHWAIKKYILTKKESLLSEDNKQKFNNFKTFLVGFPHQYMGIQQEKRLFSVDCEPTISGKYDIIMDGCLIDIKSAKYFRTAFQLQLSGYSFLLKQNKKPVKTASVLLLGGSSPQLIYININERGFLNEYKTSCAVLDLPTPPLTTKDYGQCIFCEYVHHCRGEEK